MDSLFAYLGQLMTSQATFFESMGRALFKDFAIILIVWFGVTTALSSATHGDGFHFDKFAGLILTLSFGLAMVTFYSQPIPGIGISFYHLIVDQGFALADKLNQGVMNDVWTRIDQLYRGMETPWLSAIYNTGEVFRYIVIGLVLTAAQVVLFVIISFGYVATSIAVLLGPVFIPFFIVPHMEWMFWGWLKALIQYAFYPVVANAYLFIFGNLLIRVSDAQPPPYDGPRILLLFFPLLVILCAFTYGLVKVPSLVNSLFTGRAGESAYPTSWNL